jgi:hypothetical protein
MPWRPTEYAMIRCWVDGRSWWYEDHGATPREARVLAWAAWWALSPAQQRLELVIVPLAAPDRPCYSVSREPIS